MSMMLLCIAITFGLLDPSPAEPEGPQIVPICTVMPATGLPAEFLFDDAFVRLYSDGRATFEDVTATVYFSPEWIVVDSLLVSDGMALFAPLANLVQFTQNGVVMRIGETVLEDYRSIGVIGSLSMTYHPNGQLEFRLMTEFGIVALELRTLDDAAIPRSGSSCSCSSKGPPPCSVSINCAPGHYAYCGCSSNGSCVALCKKIRGGWGIEQNPDQDNQ